MFKKKIWDKSSKVSPDDFNRIECAIEDLYNKYSSLQQELNNLQEQMYLIDVMKKKLDNHIYSGQSHSTLFNQKIDKVQFEDLLKQVQEIKNESEQ